MSHTPGPWFDDGYRIYAPTNEEEKRYGRVIVEYKHVADFVSADADLIAAAPELLKALKALLWLYRAETKLQNGDNAVTVDAHNAIAKAEGA